MRFHESILGFFLGVGVGSLFLFCLDSRAGNGYRDYWKSGRGFCFVAVLVDFEDLVCYVLFSLHVCINHMSIAYNNN